MSKATLEILRVRYRRNDSGTERSEIATSSTLATDMSHLFSETFKSLALYMSGHANT